MIKVKEIEAILKERKIGVLLHFTQLDNLPSILQQGLLCKDELNSNAKCNDEHRLDNHTDTISVSVQHPNSPMFYKYRIQNRAVDWCVLGINPNILLQRDALFCPHNAASSEIRWKSEQELRTPNAFESMFDELDGQNLRQEEFLLPSDPTDVQAEILIKGNIPPSAIFAIAFTSEQAAEVHKQLVGDRVIKIHRENVTYLSRRDIQRKRGNG